MIVPIKTNINVFYRALLTLMSNFPPIRGLRPKEIEVLAEIMYQNYCNKDTEDFEKRQLIIFSTKSRIEMRNKLGMKEGSFNDYIKRLKKKKVITKNNTTLKFLDIIPFKNYEFNIKFDIHE